MVSVVKRRRLTWASVGCGFLNHFAPLAAQRTRKYLFYRYGMCGRVRFNFVYLLNL